MLNCDLAPKVLNIEDSMRRRFNIFVLTEPTGLNFNLSALNKDDLR